MKKKRDSVVVLDNFTRDEMKQIVAFVESLKGKNNYICIHPLYDTWKISSPIEEVSLEGDQLVLASELEKNKKVLKKLNT